MNPMQSPNTGVGRGLCLPVEEAVPDMTTSLERMLKAGRELLTTKEAAAVLDLKPQTLRKWACYENGPMIPRRVGRSVRWRITDVAKLAGLGEQGKRMAS